MNRTEYILKQLAKTNKKNYENYVITRIWNLLNDLNIKIVTQQHVTRPSVGRALTDLYFPQINLHIEVDEGQHFKKGEKVTADIIREADIINATGHKLERIKVSEGGYDIDISDINKRIDDVVEIIKTEFNTKNPPAWDIAAEYNPQTYIEKGKMSADENVAFRTIADACNCFGNSYKRVQKCHFKHPYEDRYLWFPKLYANGDWNNNISDDENVITFNKVSGQESWFKENIVKENKNKEVLVFAHYRSNLGDVMYRFKGVYKVAIEESIRSGFEILKRTSREVNTYPPINK